jgi:hypothetical protein
VYIFWGNGRIALIMILTLGEVTIVMTLASKKVTAKSKLDPDQKCTGSH